MELNIPSQHLFFEYQNDYLVVKNDQLHEVFRTSKCLHLWLELVNIPITKSKGIIHSEDFMNFVSILKLRKDELERLEYNLNWL